MVDTRTFLHIPDEHLNFLHISDTHKHFPTLLMDILKHSWRNTRTIPAFLMNIPTPLKNWSITVELKHVDLRRHCSQHRHSESTQAHSQCFLIHGDTFSCYYLHSSMFNSSLWVPLHFLTVEAFQTCVTPSMWCRFDILRLKASHHLNRNELYGNLAAYWWVQKRTFPKWNKMKSCGLPTWAANGVNSRSTLSDEVFVVCAEINRMASGGTAVCSMQ